MYDEHDDDQIKVAVVNIVFYVINTICLLMAIWVIAGLNYVWHISWSIGYYCLVSVWIITVIQLIVNGIYHIGFQFEGRDDVNIRKFVYIAIGIFVISLLIFAPKAIFGYNKFHSSYWEMVYVW